MFLFYFFVVSIFLLITLWKDTRKPKGFPPGPKWLPILGVLPLVSNLNQMYKFHHLVWAHLAKRYGTIVGLRLGSKKIIIVSGREAIKEFYTYDEFDGRPDGFFFRVRSFGKRLGVAFSDGKFWEEQRKFSMKSLKQLGLGRNSMVMHIERESLEMIEYFKEKTKTGKSISMHNAFDISVLNVMWSLIAGYRFSLDDEKLTNLMDMIHESFRIVDMSGGILNQFPFLRYLIPEKSGYGPLIRTLTPLWNFLKEMILEIKQTMDKNEEAKSFIEAFIHEMEKKRNTFTDQQLLLLCLDFFQAGSETTSNTLGFGISYMIHHPEIQERIRDELYNIIGNRLPTLNDRSQLRYTEAVICEILRLSSVTPLALAHRNMKDNVKFHGYIIPKDTIAIISLYSIHMDQTYWKDPETFRPERFLDNNGNIINHDNFLPFGSGKRRCMGENLAKSSLFLFFASFMQTFNFKIPENENLPDLFGIDGITLSPKPFNVILNSR